MTIEKWIEIIVFIIAGISTAIPLIIKLTKYIKIAVREKNWANMLRLVIKLMEEAEDLFESGADKKIWVLKELESLSDTIDYDIDIDAVSAMIDALCAMSKIVNAPGR